MSIQTAARGGRCVYFEQVLKFARGFQNFPARIAGRDGSILPVENAIDGGQIHAPANGVGKQVILLLLICAQVERPERGGVETAAIAEGL